MLKEQTNKRILAALVAKYAPQWNFLQIQYAFCY